MTDHFINKGPDVVIDCALFGVKFRCQWQRNNSTGDYSGDYLFVLSTIPLSVVTTDLSIRHDHRVYYLWRNFEL